MCGCDHSRGFLCEQHKKPLLQRVTERMQDFRRLADFKAWTNAEALRYLHNLREAHPPTGPVKRIPVPIYIGRIRAGTD